jgi:hypothetical protein
LTRKWRLLQPGGAASGEPAGDLHSIVDPAAILTQDFTYQTVRFSEAARRLASLNLSVDAVAPDQTELVAP